MDRSSNTISAIWNIWMRKKTLYSGRHKICNTDLVIFTLIAQNYENRNIFFFKICIFHEKCDLSVLIGVKWTSESKVIDIQTLNLFSENWKLAYKRYQIFRSTANFFSPAKTHAIPPFTTWPSSANKPAMDSQRRVFQCWPLFKDVFAHVFY